MGAIIYEPRHFVFVRTDGKRVCAVYDDDEFSQDAEVCKHWQDLLPTNAAVLLYRRA
jgi:hypothetical protein